MLVKKLTAREAERAPLATDSSYYIMEAGAPESLVGFGVRVGRRYKHYVVRFRRVPYKIGRVDLVPIEAAREAARKKLLQLVGGEQIVSGERTLRQLRDAYQERHSRARKAERSADDDERMWDQRVLPFRLEDGRELRSLRVGEVTADHLSQLHVAMKEHPFLANRVLALLSHAFSLAVTWRWRDGRDPNPTRGIQRYPEPTKRERHYSDDEYAAWGRAIGGAYLEAERAAAAGKRPTLSPFAVGCCELLVYTGARPAEARTLDWSWLRLLDRRFRLPTAKGDRAGNDVQGRDVWLNEPALRVLRRMAELQGCAEGFPTSGPVFPGREAGKPLATIQKPWRALCETAGIGDATPKTLRHSFVTEGQRAGVAVEGMADLAGHSDIETTDRSYRARVAELNRANAETMGRHLAAKMNPTQGVN